MSAKDLTPWKPGQSGNLKGKPKGTKHRSTVIRELLALNGDDGVNNEYKMMDALLKKAQTGDVSAVKEIQDTMYGKIPDKVLTAETEPENLDIDVTDELLKHVPTDKLEEIINNAKPLE